jgi:hypothetical protein
LISRDYQSDLERKNDLFIHDFLELLNVEKIDYQTPVLDEDKIRQALVKVSIRVDEDVIVSFILNGYRLLINMKIKTYAMSLLYEVSVRSNRPEVELSGKK